MVINYKSMQSSVVRLDGSQVVTRRISNHYPRISRSSRIIRTSQLGTTQPSVLNGKESLLYESKVIDTRPVTRIEADGSRVITTRLSQHREDGRVTTVRTSGYTKRYDDGLYRSYTRPSRTYVKEESLAQDGSRVVRYSRYGNSVVVDANGIHDGSRVIRYSRHGLVDGDRVIRYSRHGTVDGERVVRYSRHGLVDGDRVVRVSRHGIVDGDRVIRYSTHGRPSRSYVLDNGVKVIKRDEVTTSRVIPTIETTVETREPIVYRSSRTSRSLRKTLPGSFTGSKNKISLENWNTYHNFLDGTRVYRSVLNNDDLFTSQREVKYIDSNGHRVYRYDNNDNYVTRTVIDEQGNRVTRTSRVIKANDPTVTRIVA